MQHPALLALDWRATVAIAGDDAVSFLQGLVSNDVTRVAPDRAVWTAFLTPQGKFLHEFMMVRDGDRLLLDCERARRADLVRRLRMYRLRSKVTIAESDETVVAVYGTGAAAALGAPLAPGAARTATDETRGGVVYGDPRHAALGLRGALTADGVAWARSLGLAEGAPGAWDRVRIAAGVPDGSRDLEVEKAILLENGFDELGGLDWNKGCYLGQELTARTRYRGLIRKRLLPVGFDGEAPDSGADVMRGDKPVGVVRSVADGLALARLRLEALEPDGPPLQAGRTTLVPQVPDWVRLPAPASSST